MADNIVYQRSRIDGNPDWRAGDPTFDAMWEEAFDFLRFHRGGGFHVLDKMEDHTGPAVKLGEAKDRLKQKLNNNPVGDIFGIKSEADGFGIAFRRQKIEHTKGQQVLEHARDVMGTPYHLGGTDCSWLTMMCYGKEGVSMPHNAHAQHLMDITINITRQQVKPGDLVFHRNDEHVSLFLDFDHGAGRVIDTEPSDAPAPWGGMLGTGVRIRTMNEGYYCDWSHAQACRVKEINGPV